MQWQSRGKVLQGPVLVAPPRDVKTHVTASVLCSQGSEEEAEDRLAVSRLVTMLKEGRSSGGSSDNDKQE